MGNEAANSLVNIIKDIIHQELSSLDKTFFCQVVNRVDETHYTLNIVPDTTYSLQNVVNMTRYDLKVGDYCYIYAIDNDLSNAFICHIPSAKDSTQLPAKIDEEALKQLKKITATQNGEQPLNPNPNPQPSLPTEGTLSIGENGNWYINGKDTGTCARGENGRGIVDITKTNTVENIDTYTITYTDETTSTFTVTNGIDGTSGNDGRGISSITFLKTEGLVDTYQINYTDNTTSTFTVTNGKDGSGGGTTVIGNPPASSYEQTLERIKIGDDYYKINHPTEVCVFPVDEQDRSIPSFLLDALMYAIEDNQMIIIYYTETLGSNKVFQKIFYFTNYVVRADDTKEAVFSWFCNDGTNTVTQGMLIDLETGSIGLEPVEIITTE